MKVNIYTYLGGFLGLGIGLVLMALVEVNPTLSPAMNQFFSVISFYPGAYVVELFGIGCDGFGCLSVALQLTMLIYTGIGAILGYWLSRIIRKKEGRI